MFKFLKFNKTKKVSVAVLVNSNKEMLLGLRNDSNKWSFVGGGKEGNETVAQTVAREVFEEVGIALDESAYKFLGTQVLDDVEVSVFSASIGDTQANHELDVDREFSATEFFTHNEIKELDLHIPHRDNAVCHLMMEGKVEFDSIEVDSATLSRREKSTIVKQAKELITKLKEDKNLSRREKSTIVRQTKEQIGKLKGEAVPKNNPDDELEQAKKFIKPYMPQSEFEVLTSSDENNNTILKVAEDIKRTPKIPKQDSLGDKAIVYLHYFTSGSDWYITELNKDEKRAFGYVILNGDKEMAELGYISIDEIVSVGAELDLYWSGKTLETIKGTTQDNPDDENIDNLNEANEKAPVDNSNKINTYIQKGIEILSAKKEVKLEDLIYFDEDVFIGEVKKPLVDFIEDEINNGNLMAEKLLEDLTDILNLFNTLMDSIDFDDINSDLDLDDITATSLKKLMSIAFLDNMTKGKSDLLKKEKAIKKIREMIRHNPDVKASFERIVDTLSLDADSVYGDVISQILDDNSINQNTLF